MIIINDTYEFDFDIENPIPFTKTNQDVKELGKRKGDYSNTFTLPNNADVREAMGFNHDPAAWDYSGHTETINCRYVENGATLMDGLIKLIEASETEIKVQIIGKQLDWKQQIADKECSELDVGTFELTRSNVIDTWTPGNNVVFPVVDWGFFAMNGWSSNWAQDDPNAPRIYKLYDCYPAFHLTYLIEKILNDTGFSVEISSELDNYYVLATSLISEVEIGNYYNYKIATGSQAISGIETIIFDYATASNPDYNTSTGIYTVPTDSRMKFKTFLNFSRSSGTTSEVVSFYIYRKVSGSTNYINLSTETFYFQIGQTTATIILETDFVDLLSNDEIFVQAFASSTVGLSVLATSYFENTQYLGYLDGDIMDLSYFLPDWTQLQLLQHIKSVFNLYFNTEGRNIQILTKSEYLKSTIVDLTDRVDRNKYSYIEYFEYSKKVKLQYSLDSNDKKAPDTFANEDFDTGIVINSNEEVLSTGFAATIMGAASHLNIAKPIPKIYSEDLGNRLPFRNLDIVPRILYYNENYTEDIHINFESTIESEIPAFKFYDLDLDEGKSLLFNNEAGNGLRRRYYSEDLAIRQDGRIFHCWVNYNEIQISNLDIRNIFRIDNTLFELKEIKQYQTGRSTEFELIPLQKAKPLNNVASMPGSIAYNPHFEKNTNNGVVNKFFNYVAENIHTQYVDDDNEIDSTYNLIRLDSSEGSFSKSLPIAPEGKIFEIDKYEENNTVTLTTETGVTIDGSTSYELRKLQKLRIKLVGSDWVILSSLGDDKISQSLLQLTATNFIWVNKQRTDVYTPDGTFARPFLSFTAAITYVATQSPDVNNQFTIVCLDPNVYDENLEIDDPYLHIFAPNTDLTSDESITLYLTNNSEYNKITFKGVYNTKSDLLKSCVTSLGDYLEINIGRIGMTVASGVSSALYIAIRIWGDYNIYNIEVIDIEGNSSAYPAYGFYASGTNLTFNLKNLNVSGSGICYGGTSGSNDYIGINMITLDSASGTTKGLYIAPLNSTIDVGIINEIGTASTGLSLISPLSSGYTVYNVGNCNCTTSIEAVGHATYATEIYATYGYVDFVPSFSGTTSNIKLYFKAQGETITYTSNPSPSSFNANVLLGDTDGGDFTITLPDYSGWINHRLTIKNTGSNVLTIDPAGAGTIDGSSTYSLKANTSCVLINVGNVFTILHVPVTLDANAETILSLTGQEVNVDDQSANTVFAGPVSGSPDVPSFRALVFPDIPSYPGTNILWVDGQRTDTYTADGTILRPYKTFNSALAAVSSPSITNQWVLATMDANVYDEQITLTTSHDYVHIHAPNATFKKTGSSTWPIYVQSSNSIITLGIIKNDTAGIYSTIYNTGTNNIFNIKKVEHIKTTVFFPNAISDLGTNTTINIDLFLHTNNYANGFDSLRFQGSSAVIRVLKLIIDSQYTGNFIKTDTASSLLDVDIASIEIDSGSYFFIFNLTQADTINFRTNTVNQTSGSDALILYQQVNSSSFNCICNYCKINELMDVDSSGSFAATSNFVINDHDTNFIALDPNGTTKINLQQKKVGSYSSTDTIEWDENIILCDTDGGSFTINIPDFTGWTNKEIRIKNTGSSGNTVTIDPYSTGTIDGSSTKALADGESCLLLHTGSNAFITI